MDCSHTISPFPSFQKSSLPPSFKIRRHHHKTLPYEEKHHTASTDIVLDYDSDLSMEEV